VNNLKNPSEPVFTTDTGNIRMKGKYLKERKKIMPTVYPLSTGRTKSV
jgi:hypothetical protein